MARQGFQMDNTYKIIKIHMQAINLCAHTSNLSKKFHQKS